MAEPNFPLELDARLLNQNGLATIEPGTEPLLILIFEGGAQGRTVDVRPALPIVLRQ